MRRALAPPILILFVLLAVLLRSVPERNEAADLDPGLRSELGSALWIRSPKAAAELRRAELCLATDRIARNDAFLDHPSGSGAGAAAWARVGSPVFPWILAGIAERVLDGSDSNGPASNSPESAPLGGVSEAALEEFAARVPLVLTGLTGVLLGLVALGLGSTTLGLASVLALWAVFPLEGRLGQLGAEGVVTLLAPGFVYAIHRARTAASTDAALFAMVAGFLASLACLLHGTGLPLAFVGGLVLLAPALERDRVRARDGLRTGLLYMAACAMPIAPATHGPLSHVAGHPTLVSGLTRGLLLLLVPFLVAGILEGSKLPTSRRWALALGLPCLMALFVPGLSTWLREGWWPALAPTSMSVAAPTAPAGLHDSPGRIACRLGLIGLGLLLVVRPWILRPAAPESDQQPTPGLRGSEAYGVLAILASVLGVAALGPFLIPAALATFVGPQRVGPPSPGLQQPGLFRPGRHPARLAILGGSLGLLGFLLPTLGLLPLDLLPSGALGADPGAPRSEANGEARTSPAGLLAREAALIRDLRALRTESPSPGPWNHPSQTGSYGLLAPPSHAALVAYHARRPVVGALPGLEEEPGRAVARALVLGPTRARSERDSEANFAWAQARGIVTSNLFAASSPGLLERADLEDFDGEAWAFESLRGSEVRMLPESIPSSIEWEDELQAVPGD